MQFFIGLLTAVLVLTCVALIFLILIQLPKKEAGMGVAFGAGATDALFGAGSGSNALTKMTRYSTITFLALALVLSILIARQNRTTNPNFGVGVDKVASERAQPETASSSGPAASLVAAAVAGASNAPALTGTVETVTPPPPGTNAK